MSDSENFDDIIPTPEGGGEEVHVPARARSRKAGRGAAGRRAARTGGGPGESHTYIKRKIPVYEVLNEEALALIEANADKILEEIGIEFRDDEEALEMWRAAGAHVDGQRVRFPKGLCRELLKTAPSQFTQHARNPARSVQIGGDATVFAPVYGPPFVRDLDGQRRYATIEDFRNFVKLAYMAPSIHHSGGTVCEPVDVPVVPAVATMGRRSPARSAAPLPGEPARSRPVMPQQLSLF